MKYRYRYVGDTPVVTYDPPAEWESGDCREVDRPIDNPWFVLIPGWPEETGTPAPAPTEEE